MYILILIYLVETGQYTGKVQVFAYPGYTQLDCLIDKTKADSSSTPPTYSICIKPKKYTEIKEN
jgi:hypothetical protein